MAFGRQWRTEWLLDPEVVYLNHPTVGATPRRILDRQREIRDEIERQPSRFLLRELTSIAVGRPSGRRPRMREAADAVAAFVGARGDDLVFVDNATTGVNAVMRSFPLAPGDEVLVSDLVYGGVERAARYAVREKGATLRTVVIPEPFRPDTIVQAFTAAAGQRTRLAIVDHIAAESAIILPVAAVARRLRAAGVAVLVDGAHAPGALALDIPSLGADYYAANLHKSAFTPRSSGFLWAAPERQAGLHPPVISWGLDQGMTSEFDLVGTRDPSAHLTAPAAIALIEEWGGAAIREYNHALVRAGARMLSDRWGTVFDVPESMIATMATVPLPASLGHTADAAASLRDGLLFDDGIEVQVHAFRGRIHVRVSAQVYNDMSDFERLADAVSRRSGDA